ncbi:MAG: helix-turn-helix transcriptional regulator [Phycisphaerales bacterium]|nr:helix-turn-helix transcriptional regulator [Phycisphaerales bacterium]
MSASPAISFDVFQAIADPTRRRLIDMLGTGGELPVKDLAAPFDMSQPAISQHLRVLRAAGLVTFRRVGRMHYYALDAIVLKIVYDWVGHYEQFWTDRLAALGAYLDHAHPPDPESARDVP